MVEEGEEVVAVAEVVAIEMIVTVAQVKRKHTLILSAVVEKKLARPSLNTNT